MHPKLFPLSAGAQEGGEMTHRSLGDKFSPPSHVCSEVTVDEDHAVITMENQINHALKERATWPHNLAGVV